MPQSMTVETDYVGYWKPTQKRYVKPIVRTALDLAQDGLSEFGVTYKEPKQATVRRVGRNDPIRAEALDSQHLDFFIDADIVKRRKTQHLETFYSVTALHELLHCIRFEQFSDDSLAELSACEGISYWFANLFAHELLPEKEARVADLMIGESDMRRLPVLREHLQSEIAAQGSQPMTDEVWDKWMEPSEWSVWSPGVSLGVIAVRNIYQQGASLPNIIVMPANDILANI